MFSRFLSTKPKRSPKSKTSSNIKLNPLRVTNKNLNRSFMRMPNSEEMKEDDNVTKSLNPKHTLIKKGQSKIPIALKSHKNLKQSIGRANSGLDKEQLNKIQFYIKRPYLLDYEKEHPDKDGVYFKLSNMYQSAYKSLNKTLESKKELILV